MKIKFFILIVGLITIIGCNSDIDIQQNIEGNYVGTFERNNKSSNVTLNFVGGKFIGESEITKFPAICNGNFSMINHALKFANKCPWTAEFDWSLILSGEWEYYKNGDKLILTNAIGDKYSLLKK